MRLPKNWQIIGLGSIALFSIASIGLQAIAQIAFPASTTLQQLRGRTKIPVLLPEKVETKFFTNVSAATANSYSVTLDLAPNCTATACNAAAISGEKGGQFIDYKSVAGPRSSTSKVKLRNGIPAQFVSGCGAYCTATLQWKSDGILYEVYVKNGSVQNTVAIANSALSVGIRSMPQAAVLAYGVGAQVELTNPGAGREERINIRDRASTQSKVRHIGYEEDALTILGRASGTDKYGWYQVKFNTSGATGWVREDFVVASLSAADRARLQQ